MVLLFLINAKYSTGSWGSVICTNVSRQLAAPLQGYISLYIINSKLIIFLPKGEENLPALFNNLYLIMLIIKLFGFNRATEEEAAI
jgi:hypothetical protein